MILRATSFAGAQSLRAVSVSTIGADASVELHAYCTLDML